MTRLLLAPLALTLGAIAGVLVLSVELLQLIGTEPAHQNANGYGQGFGRV